MGGGEAPSRHRAIRGDARADTKVGRSWQAPPRRRGPCAPQRKRRSEERRVGKECRSRRLGAWGSAADCSIRRRRISSVFTLTWTACGQPAGKVTLGSCGKGGVFGFPIDASPRMGWTSQPCVKTPIPRSPSPRSRPRSLRSRLPGLRADRQAPGGLPSLPLDRLEMPEECAVRPAPEGGPGAGGETGRSVGKRANLVRGPWMPSGARRAGRLAKIRQRQAAGSTATCRPQDGQGPLNKARTRPRAPGSRSNPPAPG